MTDDPRRLYAALEDAEAALAERDRLTTKLEHARAVVEEDRARLAPLEEALAREAADVATLESYSPSRIWAALRGTRDGDLERERAEHQAAEYAAAEQQARVDRAQAEVDALREALNAYADAPGRRTVALDRVERWLRASPQSAVGAELTDLAVQRGRLEAQRTEVAQAVTAAVTAQQALDRAAEVLGSARGWSTYDTFFDGGLIADAVKYDRIDRAERLMRDADGALRHLARELSDIGMAGVGGVEVSSMLKTFDVWFDNIFSDWSVRDRIGRADQRVRSARAAVAEVRPLLSRRTREVDQELAALAGRREEILLAPR